MNKQKLLNIYEKLLIGVCTCIMSFLVANVGIILLVGLIKILRFWYTYLGK